MHNTHIILSILLTLMLAGGNIALSGHVSSHAASDFGSCSFCIHLSGSDDAITPQVSTPFVVPVTFKLKPNSGPPPSLQIILHDNQSRAPPVFT